VEVRESNPRPMAWNQGSPGAACYSVSQPGDHIGKSPIRAQSLFESLGSRDRTLRQWPSSRR